MMRIGITGGIGSGKSYVCRRLEALGYPVYDCDAAAKRLMCDDAEIMEGLVRLMGPEAYVDGRLNKPAVARYLFHSGRHAAAVNSLVHPAVSQDFVDWAQRQATPLVFVESALLFQAQMEKVCDAVWAVSAPLEVRVKRVMQRDHVDEKDVNSRMAQQMDDSEVLRRSDAVILNDGQQDIDSQLNSLIKSLKTSNHHSSC